MTQSHVSRVAAMTVLLASGQALLAADRPQGEKVGHQVQHALQRLGGPQLFLPGTWGPELPHAARYGHRQVTPHHWDPAPRQVVMHPGHGTPCRTYFSPRLGARFEIERIHLAGFTPFRAARLVSQPACGSPMAQLGLAPGDMITRLDGIPVRGYDDLERHVYDTRVRFIRAGYRRVEEGIMFVPPHPRFPEIIYDPFLAEGPINRPGRLRP